jgi:long-chain acyl-CoA synthetase
MFCYTSGTTGDAKAVMLTHGNFMAAVTGAKAAGVLFTEEDRYLSYLPLAHSLEKVVNCMIVIEGSSIGYFSGDPLKLLEDM